MDAAIWGLIGTIVGAAVSIATTMLSHRNAAMLQRQADGLDRLERSRAFQRDNLLGVQDTLQQATRYIARAVHEDIMAVAQGTPWRKYRLSDEVNEGIRASNARLTACYERIADDALRAACKNFHAAMNAPLYARNEIEAEAAFHQSTQALANLMDQLGSNLRRLY